MSKVQYLWNFKLLMYSIWFNLLSGLFLFKIFCLFLSSHYLLYTQKQLNKTKFMLPLKRTSVTQKSKVGRVLDIVPSIKTHSCSLSQLFPPPLCWNVTGNNEILAMNVFRFFSTMISRLLEQNQKITCVCVSGLYLVYFSI